MTVRSGALAALAASVMLMACGGGEEASGPDLSDPRAVAENFTTLLADGDPAACDLIGPGMLTELTATAPGLTCAEAVESGEAAKAVFLATTPAEVVAALPDAELDDAAGGLMQGEGAKTLRVEPAEGVQFGVAVAPVPGEGTWLVNGTTSGQVEVIRPGAGDRKAE